MSLSELTAVQLQENLRNKTLEPDSLLDSVLTRIKTIDKKIKSFVRVFNNPAVNDSSNNQPLKGIPIATKDNICIKDELATCSSKILEGFRPPYNATVVERLKNAGAVIVGNTNMDEFAFGSSTETSCYGPTHNPWNLDRVVGGSSGGSAAAVAARLVPWALGSDTGGSIRQPAALCGVVGLKPTYGCVSRFGLIAFASSLDQIGPITRNVKDSTLLMNVIAGHDENDSTSVDFKKPDYTQALVNDAKGLTIGIPSEYFTEGIDHEVKTAVEEAITLLKKLGAKIQKISLPHTEYAVATYYVVATAEASSNLARFDGVQYGLRKTVDQENAMIEMYKETRKKGFGKEAKRRIILGAYTLSAGYYDAYYLKSLKVRTLIHKDFEKAFQAVDCIVTPTSPTPAFKIGEKLENPLAMYLSDIYTIPANLAGIPGISIPCGFTKGNLPIGLQILAKPFAEETIFRVAYTYEQATDWHKKSPQL
ncbi:Asp-tRNA(Asn)/Glu-tRNA(Gln) amidotransferase subunit GatA [Candidatus Omnitrophota bacterium]